MPDGNRHRHSTSHSSASFRPGRHAITHIQYPRLRHTNARQLLCVYCRFVGIYSMANDEAPSHHDNLQKSDCPHSMSNTKLHANSKCKTDIAANESPLRSIEVLMSDAYDVMAYTSMRNRLRCP
jgi:hypothetical protein